MRKKSGSFWRGCWRESHLHGLLKGAYNRMEPSGRLQNGGWNCVFVSQIHRETSEKNHPGKIRRKVRKQKNIWLTSWNRLGLSQSTDSRRLIIRNRGQSLPDSSRNANKIETSLFLKKQNETFFKLAVLTFSDQIMSKKSGNSFFVVPSRDH